METAFITEDGLVRKNNEDSVFCDDDLKLYIVADGMGGHSAGEIASKVAVETLKNFVFENKDSAGEETLRAAFYAANSAVFELAQSKESYKGMGTTLTAAWLKPEGWYIAHIGDSRAYLLSAKKLQLLTHDHSLAAELYRKGGLTKKEAAKHPNKHMLTRALGNEKHIIVDEVFAEWQNDDTLFLCTDGLTNLVSDKELKKIITKKISLEDILKQLRNLALKRGGSDNISIILIKNTSN